MMGFVERFLYVLPLSAALFLAHVSSDCLRPLRAKLRFMRVSSLTMRSVRLSHLLRIASLILARVSSLLGSLALGLLLPLLARLILPRVSSRSEEHTSELQSPDH